MGILYAGKFEILFPVRPFLLERRGAIADFHPAGSLVGTQPRVLHIAQVFPFRDRAPTKSLILDGLKELGFAVGFHPGTYEITHGRKIADCRFLIKHASVQAAWMALKSTIKNQTGHRVR
jgi:hypothetical protein